MKAGVILNISQIEFDLEDYGYEADAVWSDLSEEEKNDVKDCLYTGFIDNVGFSINIEED